MDFCSNGFINKFLKDGLSIDKLEEQLNVLKANFTEKQTLIEEMMAKCKVGQTKRSRLKKTKFYDNKFTHLWMLF